VGVGAERDAEGAREAEVGEFEVAFFVDEEVLGFEVAVEDAVGVAVAGSLEELVGEFLDLYTIFTLVNVRVAVSAHMYAMRVRVCCIGSVFLPYPVPAPYAPASHP